jgi:conjugal transfer pilus assembly protein TraW
VAWVRGLVDGRWLKDQVEKEGRTGDLGKYGPTEAVAERDFLEEIQERIASIDWKAKKEQAWQRYWTHYSFLTLPPAPRDRVYQVDAVYEVPQDFILPDGKVLARKGEKINLFEKVPPHFVLVVFDAGDPRQLAWAKKAGREVQKRFQVQYLTTSLPERTWECFERLEKALDEPLYLLNETVRARFHLAHVPSLVRPLEDRFEVREFKMGKDQGEKDVAQVSHR